MTSNPQTLRQEIRQEFEMLLEFVSGEPAQTATADQIERGLFKLLLAVGAKLLMLFFGMRSEACSGETIQSADGQTLPYERDTKRSCYSIFGKLPLWRPYFYQQGVGGETPLDAELDLGEDSYSDLLPEMSDYLGVYNVYHKTSDILSRLAQQVAARDGEHIRHRVALCDGSEPLQTRLTHQFPDFTLILDFIHADEYLWDVANSLLSENDPHREQWMAEDTLKILPGQTQQVIATFQQMAQDKQYTAKQRTQLAKTANYFQRNLPYMDYATYLKRGWPIASGVIEGACRHFVKDRCELSGMPWTQSGVENLFRLRAIAENGDGDEYHQFRKRQRHTRLYDPPYPEQIPLAMPARDNNSLLEKRPVTTTAQDVELITSPDTQALYHQLPLAV